MKNFTKLLFISMVILVSSSMAWAQIQSSHTGDRVRLLPSTRAIIYEQMVPGPTAISSQDFEAAYDAYDARGADDFTVPAGTVWQLETISVLGSGGATMDLINFYIYQDAGGVPAASPMYSYTNVPCTNLSGTVTWNVPGGSLVLGPGTYWFSMQGRLDFATGGQWYWYLHNGLNNNLGHWINPGGGFGLGTSWITVYTGWGYNLDFSFRFEGSVLPAPTCDYSIRLYDTYGDGWNGCYLDVLVNGVVVLDDITLSDGLGPATYTFPVEYGAEITTVFYPVSWISEPYYYIDDSEGNTVWYSPPSSSGPPNVNPGDLYGVCPLSGDLQGYVFNYDGLAINGATVAIPGVAIATSGPDGSYMLTGAPAGLVEVFCTKQGYNVVSAMVNIPAGGVGNYDFVLTQPSMVVQPLSIEETVNPEEYFTTTVSVLNNGSGPLHWMSEVIYPPTEGSGGAGNIRAYCAAGASVFDEYISNVTFGTINNTTSWSSGGYGDYTAMSTDVVKGETYPISVLIGNPWSLDIVGAWIDWNQDEQFDEPMINFTGSPTTGFNGSFTVPEDAESGPTRIRIRMQYGGTLTPCGIETYGEVEDYTVNVSGAGNWLTMDYYEGDVPAFGGSNNIPTHLDASGVEAGTVLTADIVFTSDPDVGTITVPVTMIVTGNPLVPPTDLAVELVDDLAGETYLTWSWAGRAFQYFMVKRDGMVVGTTTNTYYTDFLPDYGYYCYTVQAVYDEGATAPAGPECVEWANPDIFVDPTSLEGWVWVDNQVTVYTTIHNNGEGSLQYQFPDWVEGTDEITAYCAAQSTYCDEYISRVVFNTIDNSSPCTNYGDYTDQKTKVIAGGSYPISVYIGNPFSGDNCGLWVDWDQNEVFDGSELTILTPNTSPPTLFTGTVTVPAGAVSGTTVMRIRLEYYGAYSPCGTQTYGEVEDYSIGANEFIVDVTPPEGVIAGGSQQSVAITYDATGFVPGDYMQDLLLTSNDVDEPEVTIDNTMHVYTPAQFAGTVVDNNNGVGMGGVSVTAGPFATTTAPNGTYSMYVDEGTYDVYFEKIGYQTVVVADTFAMQGVVTPIDVGMWDESYPPAFVTATVMDNDTWCQVEWALPEGPYEVMYDDGTAEDFALWQLGGSQNAVKFSPAGYPCEVIGGRIYVGDGSFPGPFLGTEFSAIVYDDDGPDGMPGTMLDSVGVTVNNFGWVSFNWMSAEIEDGDFYLAMLQTAASPNAAPIGVDEDLPTVYKSYSKFQANPWALSAYQDFMIRAWINGPATEGQQLLASDQMMYPSRVPENWQKFFRNASGEMPRILPGVEKAATYRAVEGATNRDIESYRVARYSDFDPNGSPEDGTITELTTQTDLAYEDYAWAGLPQGWYAYGVKALYTSGQYSEYAISNIVGHLMDFEVTVNVTLSTGGEPSNVDIMMQGLEYPYENYMATTPASGTVVFDPVWKGHYYFSAYKIGYEEYVIDDVYVYEDMTIDIVLSEKKYPPTNLYVDPKTLIATWNEPMITQVDQNFEDPQFPPAGWQMFSDGQGWFRTLDGSSTYFPIPAGDGYYACDNDDAAGSYNPGSMDYLITPPCDLRESDGFAIMFDSYYDGGYGQLAFVEYSLDAGATWEVLSQMTPSASWTDVAIDLSMFSGPNGPTQIWFAFHADDAGQDASGWAVDNAKVQVPDVAANYIDFYVFLDDAFVGSTEETTWDYAPLTYGQEYTASVGARYTSGLSEKDYYTFLCRYLLPPRNLVGIAPDDAVILVWDPPVTPGMLTLVSEEPRTEFPNPYSEYSPTVRIVEGGTPSRAPWDLQFAFGTVDNSGEAGAESDGDYLYTSMWNGTGFQQYNLDGSYVGPLSVGGVGQIRDLAYDPTTEHMFGGQATNTVYEMDFASGTQIGTINAPTQVRAIAYDEDFDGFWANNWSTNITLFDKSGTQLNSFSSGTYGNYYGFAYDDWTDGGPYLWGYSQTSSGAGNIIVQFEIATGQETGFTYDVTGILVLGTGIAGGLFTHPDLINGKVTIGGNSQNDTFFGYELAESGGGGGGGEVPDNLLGYNIYRDGDFVDYVAHPQLQYVDENLQPSLYCYTITAVYDLADYGLPGETDESMEEGPTCIPVDYCYDLEFMETWSLGNFEANGWRTDGDNWSVNGQTGNPAPAAEFSWDPIMTEYESALTSYPLCGTGITEGKIWLDFDYMLQSVNSTGEEYMNVEVWNWESHMWSTVASYSNVDGDIPWTSEHVNISAYAKDAVFKVRFNAMGMNSLDILSWFVDNIHIYRTCDAPFDLAVEEVSGGMNLSWTSPGPSPVAEWIHWDDGVNANSIGTGSAVEFQVAARWEPSMLVDYEGASVTQVAFFPAEAAASYSIRVWLGAGPGNMVVDQPVASPLIGQWNYITLDTPVPIDITQELWVGYYVNTTTGYPAGTDAGPAVDGYGNMMDFGGWQTLLEINPELDYNWNIQAYVETLAGVTMPVSIEKESYTQPAQQLTVNSNYTTPVNAVFASASGSRELTGFNIWRSVDGGDYEIIDFTPETSYLDEGPFMAGIMYCYMVQAVYESATDYCESDPSEEVCRVWSSINDPSAVSSFAIYPNPATDHVFVEASAGLKRVTVYNALGQLILDRIVEDTRYELNTATYHSGIYMIRVETRDGVNTRTLTIKR